ncbi:MAG TPA: 4Fe-4S ferredoxin [Rikenellaceae bacterium]|nr:MAG: 4Fe-4S ferredoxin [Bacteroidetes bacterium GWE2_40_15]HBZ25843.1 4Fe-4S ferredoxin [Rikenellaceae bacterium]
MITGKYLQFYKELSKEIPTGSLLHDSLSTLAFGTDASFYRLIPKLIVKVHNENELCFLIKKADEYNIPLTFRAAGTSLSGQAVTDSVLVVATHGWKGHEILDGGNKIRLQAGIRGTNANSYLVKYGKKIGPDPASIDYAMIGGIAANNASGMCCGTSENSYKTIAEIRVVLADGTVLDTASANSVKMFREKNSKIVYALEKLSEEVASNQSLKERIIKKFKIKNTTGYSLNALTDYSDGIDILKHLMIGSEGTLGFISDITFNTVTEHPNKALALMVYPDIESACNAVIILKKESVTAVEIMDRAALKSVDSAKGVPEYIKGLHEKACAILVETKGETGQILDENIKSILASVEHIKTELPVEFTKDSAKQAKLWKIRKEIFATVAGMRKSGTTPIIEDICFPINKLAQGTLELISLFEKHRYDEAVIFGHALEGNLHFVFNQDFQNEIEVKRYSDFMNDIVSMVVDNYDGSLKAEHGTGRNMAPFVEKEWGEQAYTLMKQIKELFDPKGILNPGVILNSDKEIHLKNLKPIPSTRETVDRCMECGFCEGTCVSEGFTLSPRMRIVVYKEMERLKATGEEPHRCAELHKLYEYAGLDTCATDSLCYVKCPLDIDTGKLVKELRHEGHSKRAEKIALSVANSMGGVTTGMRLGLDTFYYLRLLTGKTIFGSVATGVHKISGGLVPLWNPYFPKGSKKISNKSIVASQLATREISTIKDTEPGDSVNNNSVVYFPSCITRSMGLSREMSGEAEVTKITERLLKRAGYRVIYPSGLNSLCCGMAFSSKGFVEAGRESSDKLERALFDASDGGKIPILCDMSPCLYTMQSNFGERLKLYEPAEFISKFVLDKLDVKKLDRKISVFAVCSAKKMEVDQYLYDIAKRCAREVVIIDSNCCGFAGDRGFLLPELNKHGLRDLRRQSDGCSQGYATSRTCEIGLSNHSGITYSSIVYLVEEASSYVVL